MKTSKSHKTKKRLAAKKAMLAVATTRRNSRHYGKVVSMNVEETTKKAA